MRAIYIGQNSIGATSNMRAMILERLLYGYDFEIIDTHIPFYATNRISRSFGFRFKRGLLIKRINKYVLLNITNEYDLVWVDKAVFLTKSTTEMLSKRTKQLIHYTPDPAFTFHKSRHFRRSLRFYDYAITTKGYEVSYFEKFINKDKVILTTQGFDNCLHRPIIKFTDKKFGVVFVGHYEAERGIIVKKLIENEIKVCVAGRGWGKFRKKYKFNPHLLFLGNGIYGQDYVNAINQYNFGLGLLSKWIPELHTTRTFEIPACGTALLTESNVETHSFFKEDEAVFFNSSDDLVNRINYFKSHLSELEAFTKKGTFRVNNDGRDYESILKNILDRIGILKKEH